MAIAKIEYPRTSDFSTLKKIVKQYYDENLKGQTVVNRDKGITVIFSNVGRNHVLYARRPGFEKLVAIFKLSELVANAVFTNFKGPDKDDFSNIIGYMNFKSKANINGTTQVFRIVVRISKEGKFFYDHSVRVKK